MSEVIPPELLADNVAQEIAGAKVNIEGSIESFGALSSIMIFNQQNVDKVWIWQPNYVPLLCTEKYVIVFSTATELRMAYKISTGNAQNILLAGISGKVSASHNGNQFVFVDGINGSDARRVTIDSNGTVKTSIIGSKQPTTKPVIKSIISSIDRDDEFTGMPVGSILLYTYVVMNKMGEKSNPSPVCVMDTAQWQVKGDTDSGDYEYSKSNRGSIKSVVMECVIPDIETAKTIFLYRTSAEYTESNTPTGDYALVGIFDIGYNTAGIINVTDTNFPATEIVDYENDTAPAADMICMHGESMILGNTASNDGFLFPAQKVYRISLQNSNTAEYINQWIQFGLYDSTTVERLRLINEEIEIGNNHRFIDSDRITPLEAFYKPFNGTHRDHSTGNICNVQKQVTIRIPIIPMNSTKTIYLVEFSPNTGLSLYGRPMENKSMLDLFNMRLIIPTPVRSDNALLAFGIDSYEYSNVANQGVMMLGYHSKTNSKWIAPYNGYEYNISIPQGLTSALFPSTSLFETDIINDNIDCTKTEMIIAIGIANKASILVNEWLQIARTPLYDLWLKKLNNGNIVIGGSWVEDDQIFNWLTLPIGAESSINLYIHSRHNDPNNNLATSIYAIAEYSINGTISFASVQTQLGNRDIRKDIRTYPWPAYNINIGMLQFYTNQDVKTPYNIRQMFSHMPTFDNVPIGLAGYTTLFGLLYGLNNGVTIEAVPLANSKKPGRLRWSRGGTFPETQEVYISDGIMSVYPMKSFSTANDTNTILIWTEKGSILRLATQGERTEIITEMANVGLISSDIVELGDNIYWTADKKNVISFGRAGLKNISIDKAKHESSNLTGIFALSDINTIMFSTPVTNTMYLYNAINDTLTRTSHNYRTIAATTILPRGNTITANIYVSRTASQLFVARLLSGINTTIKTKRYRISRIIRVMVRGYTSSGSEATVQIMARLFGGKVGYYATGYYKVITNKPFSIPMLKGMDYISFEIISTNANTINGIEIEVPDEN